MSIVLELQQQAIDCNSDILSLLRKALLVAHKLGLNDFEKWVNLELNGYSDKDTIPNYRKVTGQIKGWNPYNGVWMPLQIRNEKAENLATTKMVTNSIADLYTISKSEKEIVIPMSTRENVIFSKNLPFQTTFEMFISTSITTHIIEQVKTNILNWTLKLEENGIVGEGLSFSKEEKETANNTPDIVQYTINVYGNVSNSQIQQGTQYSEQTK